MCGARQAFRISDHMRVLPSSSFMQGGGFGKSPGWGRRVLLLLNDKCFQCSEMKANRTLTFLIDNLKSRQGLVAHQKVLVFCHRGSQAGDWNVPLPPRLPSGALVTARRQASSHSSETPLRRQEFAIRSKLDVTFT